MSRLGDRALVIGGSIAGLITVRRLSHDFDQVVILERATAEDRPVLHRSVPQGHQLHALLTSPPRARTHVSEARGRMLEASARMTICPVAEKASHGGPRGRRH
jgi:hypothetical protein